MNETLRQETERISLNLLFRHLPENVFLIRFLVQIKVTGILQTCFSETDLSEKHQPHLQGSLMSGWQFATLPDKSDDSISRVLLKLEVYLKQNGSTVPISVINALHVTGSRKVRVSDPDTRNWFCAARYSHGASCRLLTDNFLRSETRRSMLL